MTVNDLAKLAYKGEIPEKLTCDADIVFWYKMREVYNEFKSGEVTKEQAASYRQLLETLRKDEIERAEKEAEGPKRADTITGDIIEWAGRLKRFWVSLEPAGNAYALDPTIENADKLYEALYGLKRGMRQ